MDHYSQQAFDKMISDIINAPKYKRLWWWVCRQVFNIRYLPKRAYRFVVSPLQRVKHGYSDSDTWNLDIYLAHLIANSVKHLRDTSKSYPAFISEDDWHDIQTKIILGFNLYICYHDDLTLTKHEREQMDEGMALFIEHFRHLWS